MDCEVDAGGGQGNCCHGNYRYSCKMNKGKAVMPNYRLCRYSYIHSIKIKGANLSKVQKKVKRIKR